MRPLLLAQVLIALLLGLPGLESRAGGNRIELPTSEEIEDAIPEGGSLTGREIYDRFLDNKLHSAVQHQTVISTDPGGNDQKSRFWIRWRDFREEETEPSDGIVARTLIKFEYPEDMRHTGFLMLLREDGDHDQFVYQPSQRRIRRVKLERQSVMGTDYTFGDIAFHNIEEADYHRLSDEEIDGHAVYVVEVRFKPTARSQYHRLIAYLEKEHYIPLRVRYWDHADVEIKELRSRVESIREFEGIWVATESTMFNLKEGTSSTLLIEKLDPNPDLAEQLFSIFRLQLRR